MSPCPSDGPLTDVSEEDSFAAAVREVRRRGLMSDTGGGRFTPYGRLSRAMAAQILYNLAENAIKYNRRGGYVLVRIEREEEVTVITVEDNGIGIPDEDQARVFERFYRVDKARSRAAGGTGLGLSIVSDTVSRRGGATRAEHGPEGGARFIVNLP